MERYVPNAVVRGCPRVTNMLKKEYEVQKDE